MHALKRLRTEYIQDGDELPWQYIVQEELALDILIRQRLAATIEGRIAWALQLQQSLQEDDTPPPALSARNDFKTAAEDALAAIESPTSFFIHHEPLYASLPSPPITPALQVPTRATSTSRSSRASRPSTKPAKLLFISYPSSTPHVPPPIAKLACTDCGRSDFPSAQGLLNHTRLKHRRAYGSHDECIAACAVAVRDEAHAAWVRANGVEVPAGEAGRPSLRRLFERAVGEKAGELLDSSALAEGVDVGDEMEEQDTDTPKDEHGEEDLTTERARHLAITLGLHKDSSGLAQFLGREPKRRCINVYDEDVDVDIGDFRPASAPEPLLSRPSWRPLFPQRGQRPTQAHDVEGPVLAPCEEQQALVERPLAPSAQRAHSPDAHSSSRFHIGARIAVSDRSLWISEGKRLTAQLDHTHYWQLSVDSPSYSRPLTTFTYSITITSLTSPPPPMLEQPILLSSPPFVLRGTASSPFLAKLTFQWCDSAIGEGVNPPIDIVHWVELDLHKRAAPVLGEEQLVDVELDRGTMFVEARPNEIPVTNWDKDDWTANQAKVDHTPHVVKVEKVAPRAKNEQVAKSQAHEDTPPPIPEKRERKKKEVEAVPAYVKRLRTLYPKAPTTMKDVTTRHPPRVPYHLAPTTAAFRRLNPGRRKAIEFAAARVLRDAYASSLSPDDKKGRDDLVPLTTADIHRILDDEGRFPRPPRVKIALPPPVVAPSPAPTPVQTQTMRAPAAVPTSTPWTPPMEFCALCGNVPHVHDVKSETGTKPEHSPCPFYPAGLVARPTLSAKALFAAQSAAIDPEISMFDAPFNLPRSFFLRRLTRPDKPLDMALWGGLVGAADGRLVLGVREAVKKLGPGLSFPEGTGGDGSRLPLNALGGSQAEVEETLAPHALLALLLSPLVKHLVQGGLTALREQRRLDFTTKPEGDTVPKKRGPRKKHGQGVVLTSSQVLVGLKEGARYVNGPGSAVFVALARVREEEVKEEGR